MKSLFDYDVLVNEVFYKCCHILDYIQKHPDISILDKSAIEATIMDALVTKGLIDTKNQSLDLDNFCIVDNLNYYNYQEHPNICGIHLGIKDEFRKKSLQITGGIPISMFLAKPPSKVTRYCVYDPNIAVSAIFGDATFYNAIYTSPTRGIRLNEVRPFVEVNIDGVDYLVDTLTKRILKSCWFKKTYDFEIKEQHTISKMDKNRLVFYKENISELNNLSFILPFILPLLELNRDEFAEMKYEINMSKIYFKDEWEKYELFQKEMKNLESNKLLLSKKRS